MTSETTTRTTRMPDNGWPEYRLLIVAEIKRHDGWLKHLENRVVALQVKAALWGALSGIISAAIGAVVVWALTG